MAIVRLALSNPSAATNTLLYTADRQALVSIIATNKSVSASATIRIWVQPKNTTLDSQYAYMAYDSPLPASNSLETFRFAISPDDKIYVRASTADVSFSLNGVYETENNQNIVTVSTTAPNAPDIGDVWVNPTSLIVAFWDGGQWTSAVGGSAGFPQPTEPVAPNQGAIWVDTDAIDPIYPSYPTVIYSPTQPTGLTVADTGTIWVDEDFPTPIETVVPAVIYQATAPTGLTQNDVGYVWIDSDENIIEYNMNDYALKTYVDNLLSTAGFNPFLLAGM